MRVTHHPGDSVEELSGCTETVIGAFERHWYSVEELSGVEGTEAVRGDLTTKPHLR